MSKSDDTINRQDVVSEIDEWIQCATDNEIDIAIKDFLLFLKKRINTIPSAESKTKCIAQIKIDRDDMEDLINKKVNEIVDKMLEPKKGHWIDEETNYSCSECHRGCWVNSDYCPWCGADMRDEEEYELATEQMEHDAMYESTYNLEDGSM